MLAIAAALPATAADRREPVADFDRLVVQGPFRITVETGRASSVVLSGAPADIERISVTSVGRRVTVRPAVSNVGVGMRGPVTIRVATRMLTSLSVSGTARVEVGAMQGARVGITSEGASSITVARIDADEASVGMAGTGQVTLAGRVKKLTLLQSGAGALDAGAVRSLDLRVTAGGAGDVAAQASRSANVTANGTGSVTVYGKPACQVQQQGAATVVCPAGDRD